MDLTKDTSPAAIQVMQDDRYSRNVELSLFSGGDSWIIPDGVSVLIRYSKADGTGGAYDTMPDGSTAWSAAENILTAALAPQVLTVPGPVTLTISLLQDHIQISLFSIFLNVKPVANARFAESEDYFHVAEFLPAPDTAQPGQYLRICAVNDAGHVTKVEAADLEIDNSTIHKAVSDHNLAKDSHADIRQQMTQKVGIDAQSLTGAQQSQVRENIGIEALLTKTAETVYGINLNDGIYETGRFTVAGEEYDAEGAYGIRNVNYLPVEGGRSIVAYYDSAAWNNNTANYSIQVVQYDADHNRIGSRGSVSNYLTTPSSCLTLDADAAYIRIDYNSNGTVVIEDLTAPKIAVYYLEDAVQEFVEYTAEITNETLWIDKSKIWALSPLHGKKIVYDGDSIAESRTNNGGGYAKLIADLTGGTCINQAQGGAHLCSGVANRHCIADNLANLPANGDLYCFQGGINDYWGNAPLGTYSMSNVSDTVDPTTVCGALETIFRYALNHFPGKPVCFVITHKIQNASYTANTAGNTFQDYRDAMVGICEKYSIPYFDAFSESGLNGWNETQNNLYLTANSTGTADGCHPNEEGYKRYYVPQLMALFSRILPVS